MGNQATNEVRFAGFMVDSSHKHAWEYKLTTFPKKVLLEPPYSAVVVLKSSRNTKGHKIHSFGDRKLKVDMQMDRMKKKYVLEHSGLRAPLRPPRDSP